jgi:hypothetical protein
MSSDPYEYLDRHTDDRADQNDQAIGEDTAWPIDEYDPDDREPMGGDPYWAGDLEWD